MRSCAMLLLALALPCAASALALGPPLDPPPSPSTPLGPLEIDAPPVATPPVAAPPLDLMLPEPLGERPGDLPEVSPPDAAQGPPDLVPVGVPQIPDLRDEVGLPAGAEIVYEVAPPFGGTPPGRAVLTPVPEPGTALLLASGLIALGARRARGR